MDLELKLHSPVGGDSITYSWPVSESDGKEGGDEVVDTIRWACEEHQELKEIVEHRILQDYDVKSYESIKKVCDRYNKAVDSFRQLKDPLWHQKPKELPSMRLVRHIVQQCYNHAVKVPEQLNHYEPFSPEVYGETSFDLVEQFINTIKMGENDYFIDLGSGVGQVVLQVAAATGCELAYGIEKAEWPATYAADMDQQFMKWMSFFGKRHGKYLLEKGDFLTDSTIKDRIESATVIFVNNFAFGPQVDHHLKGLFVNMREGAKIVSSKAFCSLNFRISDRNLSDIGSIMQVQELSPMSGAVSWTGKAFGYFIHTIDRTQLENYFQRKINPRAQNIVEPRRDRRGRLLDSKDKENNKIRRSGDHTYGAAKVLDFDSASNASTITNTISDDSNTATSLITANTTTTTATEDDNIFLGPTTRRQWTEWVNRPTSGSESLNDNESSTNNTDAEKAVVWKQKVKKRKVMKRLNNGALQKKKNSKFKKKLRVRRSPPVNTQQDQLSQMDQIAHASEHTGSHVKTNKRQAKVGKPPPLTLDSLNLLHTHTVLSTMGQGVEDSTRYNDRRMTGMAPGPFKASTQKKTVRSLDMMLPAVDQFVERCRKELMAFLSHMQSTEYIDIVRHQRDIELERHRELKRKAAMYEKEISDLQKNSIGLIRTRLDELGIEANTPSELLGHHEIMRQQHRDLQLQKTELQQEIQCLKSEQLQLVNAQVNAQKQILDPNGIVNHKKNGVVRRPVETERILQREVMSAYTNNQRLVVQVNQLEQEIQRLELINNQLIAADASAAATLTPIIPVSTSTLAPAVAMPGSKTRSGGSKGTKRKSGGSPVMPESSVAGAFQGKGGNESSSSATTSSSEKLREKLDMKENLEAYSRHVHKLKSEFSAVHNSLDITLLSGESSVKQEVKFQPPDLSFKDLLEKTRMLPCGAVKNETSASSITAVSSAGVAVSCTAPSLSPVKAEVRDVVNGSKRRRTAIGIVLPHTRAVTSSSFSISLSQNREPVSHSSLSGSTSSSSIMSSTSVASSCQGGKPASPLTDELTVAHELIRIHQIGGPPVVSSVESAASSSSDSVISSVESHRLQSNYSPISRPSSQSSIEGTEVPAAVCAASINQLAQVFPSQGSTGVCQTLMSSGVRIGTLPPSSPGPVTVNVGTMSGGCVSSPHFPGARVMVHTSQQSGPIKAAASSSTGSSTPVLASALSDTKAISSSSRPQAASCVMPAPSTQVLVQKEPRQQQVVIPSIPVSTRSKGKHITPSPNPVRVEIPFHSTTADATTPTTLVVPVPTNNNTAQGPAASGNIGALLNAPVNNKAVVKTQTGSRHQRSRSTTQPRLLQPALPRSQQQVVAISSSTVPITTYPRQVVSVSSTTVPITTYSQQEVAQVLGTSVLSPTTVDGVMQMAMVNGVPQPVRLTSLPQGINGQKEVQRWLFVVSNQGKML